MADERHDSDILSCVSSELQMIFVSPASCKSEYGGTFFKYISSPQFWQMAKSKRGANLGG